MKPEQRMIQAANMLKERADALLRYASGVEVDETAMARILATDKPSFAGEVQSLATFDTREGAVLLGTFINDLFIDQTGESILFDARYNDDIAAIEQLAWSLLAVVIKAREEQQ